MPPPLAGKSGCVIRIAADARFVRIRWQPVANACGETERERFAHIRNFEWRSVMTRNALIALASCSAIALAAPVAAQDAAPPANVGQPPAAQPSTGTPVKTPATDAVESNDQSAQSSDAKADSKAKPKADTAATCGTAVRAGPNQGQIIGKCKEKTKTDAEVPPKG
jgi:hypothetical protein